MANDHHLHRQFRYGICKILKVRVLDTPGQEEGRGVRLVQHVLQLVGLVGGLMVTSTAPTLPVYGTAASPTGHVLDPTRRRGRPSIPSAMRALAQSSTISPELRVGVAQTSVGVDERVVVGAPFVYEVEQAAYGQAFDVLRTHYFLLVSVPTDVVQSSISASQHFSLSCCWLVYSSLLAAAESCGTRTLGRSGPRRSLAGARDYFPVYVDLVPGPSPA